MYEITFDRSRFDVDAIHAFLTQAYWSVGIPRSVVERAIAGSLCIGVLAGHEQVGFARLITDKATIAWLADVYILPAHRGKGLSRRMLTALFQHPEVQGLRRLQLATRDAHGLYAKLGFKPLAHPDRFMEVVDPQIYTRQAAKVN
ncbi:N-acetyltransferase [Planctomycetota bacterium]|nr:N-acetyltransferase [Planctomycetota bacterium]